MQDAGKSKNSTEYVYFEPYKIAKTSATKNTIVFIDKKRSVVFSVCHLSCNFICELSLKYELIEFKMSLNFEPIIHIKEKAQGKKPAKNIAITVSVSFIPAYFIKLIVEKYSLKNTIPFLFSIIMCQGSVIRAKIVSPGIKCFGLKSSFIFPERMYIAYMQTVGIMNPNTPQLIVANAINKYTRVQIIIFCLFFLENKVFEAHKIAASENIQKSISLVASLEKTSVPKLVAKIKVIINAYDLDNIFFSIKNIEIMPKDVISEIGNLTTSALIFPNATQERFINQNNKGGYLKKASSFSCTLIQSL